MKLFKRNIAFLMAFIILFSIISIGSASAIGENIPTIFINNEAWYKYRILPLVMINDEPCVPISVFAGFDFLNVSYDESNSCCLISSDSGEYISINTKNCRYLTHSGERGDIIVSSSERENYISAKTAAKALGIGVELTVFYDKDVIRFYVEEEMQSLEILIDYYIESPDITQGSASSSGGSITRKEIFSAVADISQLPINTIQSLLELAESTSATMTFAIDAEFVANKKNLSLLLNMAASGHSFAISIDPESEKDALTQAEECNKYLTMLLKKKSLLICGTEDDAALSEKGYIIMNSMTNISYISNVDNINFNRTNVVNFDKIDMMNMSKFIAIVRAAEENGKTVSALNQLTGK